MGRIESCKPDTYSRVVSRKAVVLSIVSALAVALLPFLGGCQRAKTPVSEHTVVEKADVTINFNGMPAMQAVAFYEQLAGQKVAAPTAGYPSSVVRLHTEAPITKQQAMQLIEDALKQQAHVALQHGADGSLSAVLVNE